MEIDSIILVLIFSSAILYAVYLFLREPRHIIISYLRGLHELPWWYRSKIFAFIIVAPFWLIDRMFNLKIFINDISEASKDYKVDFENSDKYLLIKNKNKEEVLDAIEKLLSENNTKDKVEVISLNRWKSYVVVKLDKTISFSKFNGLLYRLSNLFFAKAVVINRVDRSSSYYLVHNEDAEYQLVGRNGRGQKIYVDMGRTKAYLSININVQYVPFFSFNRFVRQNQ